MVTGEEVVRIADTAEHVVTLEACARLATNGAAYFLVPNSFFWKAGSTAWREMHKLGSLYPSASSADEEQRARLVDDRDEHCCRQPRAT